LKTDKFGSLN